MPTALGATRRCASAVVIIVVAATIVVVVGTTAASFFTSLRGDFEELVGVNSCRCVVAGGRFDFFGGVGSLPREAVIFNVLQFLLE